MQFPDATGVPANMLFPQDGRNFEMLARFIDREYVDPADMDMRGMLHALGIEKGKPFRPDAEMKGLLDHGARTAFKKSKVVMTDLLVHEPGGKYYPDRQWLNVFAGENTSFQASGTFTNVEQRAAFFTSAYSVSPAMVVNMVGKGAKYPVTARDADGDFLDGGKSYRLHLPANIPAANFWSATVYEALTASGLDNGQPLPSLNSMVAVRRYGERFSHVRSVRTGTLAVGQPSALHALASPRPIHPAQDDSRARRGCRHRRTAFRTSRSHRTLHLSTPPALRAPSTSR